ncbi:MAG: isoaspartyl peptidase/L-asparaginase [Saprospiraceae bacterium]|nr:isoaspartyl peptidase/L-asparaginase [Saprospiraceae bacterium]
MFRFTTSLLFTFTLFLVGCQPANPENVSENTPEQESGTPAYAIALHGGAGTITRDRMTPELETEYRTMLNAALDIGEGILQAGGSSLDAVVATIEHLENSPLFNAGIGAVFTHDGRNELDASIMDGRDRNAGAVGGVSIVKNPIKAARAVMENSPHVLLTGIGADGFAILQGLDTVPNTYFFTQKRWDGLQEVLEAEEKSLGAIDFPDSKYGTVGCAALDLNGNLAAGTSTGGMTNKRYNRIGDSPIIGAGTYADNKAAAISCTGHGEYFIRNVVAYDVVARMLYQNKSLQEAAGELVYEVLPASGGTGGLISVDRFGNVAMPFNTEGMYRGYAKAGERVVAIFKDE